MLAFLLAQAVTPAALPAVDPVATDGRLYGHFRYGDAPPGDLVAAPPGFGIHACMLRREVIPDLTRLIAAADAALGPGAIRGLSCHRGVLRQGSVFARGGAGPTAADRAISVAPPGHSEHSTGFALDFAVRPSHGCPDAEACMAATPQARWLHDHAPRYGFELSFPPGNQQNVKWEPWHWRWVGTTAATPGAARARFLFARARASYPADPGIYPPLDLRLSGQPSAPVRASLPPTRKKRRR